MIPDTVYNKVLEPVKPPLPVRGINTVHDTSFGDTLVNIGLSVATGGINKALGFTA